MVGASCRVYIKALRSHSPLPFFNHSSQYQRWDRGGGRVGRGGYRPRSRAVSLLGGATLAGGSIIYVSSREEVPYTGRKHAILISNSLERALGEATFEQIKQEAAAKGTLLPRHHPATRAVERVGRRLAAVASDGGGGGEFRHMKEIKDWEFIVVDEPTVNAMVTPGGKVIVFSGLLKMMSSEKELAAVLAHEAAHVLARHTAEKVTSMQAATLVRSILYWAFGLPLPAGALELALFLPNSRKAETEADVIGVRLAARACYDPSAAVAVFTKLGQAEAEAERATGMHTPAMLRTHPLSEARVKRVQAELPAAMELWSEAGCALPQSRFRQFMDILAGEERDVERPPPPAQEQRAHGQREVRIGPFSVILDEEEVEEEESGRGRW